MHPECTKAHHFDIRNPKIFWGGGYTPPLGASILPPSALDLGAFGASILPPVQ